MIRCGILTFQYAHNYGALLQAYALKEFLNSNGIETEIINYANTQAREMYGFFPKKVNGVVDFLRKGKRCALRLKQYNIFKRFARDYLGYDIINPFLTIERISGKYCNIIVGSDQVWNTKLTNNDMAYFLDGIDCENKVSYAASFGSSDLIESLSPRCMSLLKKFDYISVREFDSQKKLQRAIEKNVALVVDPVFLLSKDEWTRIEKKPTGINQKYCCLIMLRDDPDLIKQCEILAATNNVEIICIHPMGWKQKCGRQLFNVGPQEFLWLIDHSDVVVTNSFHATAFSAIFKKKIVTGSIAKNNDRITSLIQLLSGLDDCYSGKLIDTNEFDMKIMDTKIIESKEYLLKNLI